MFYFPTALTQMHLFRCSGQFRSLSAGIVMAMCVGLLIPALIGDFALHYIRQSQVTSELDSYLHSKIELLSRSLAIPVWNYDSDSVAEIAEATLADKQVIRITVSDTQQEPIINNIKPKGDWASRILHVELFC